MHPGTLIPWLLQAHSYARHNALPNIMDYGSFKPKNQSKNNIIYNI